ncbi:MAG: cytochrome b/b6 domain-containing protein [Anaerolineales bacterium]|uniref:Cytochrome b/b6 domain-containing protein n=1 Tax=Candidatus Desulfolinea nitratireducens TaxID=2841698 RepID=A0A8J6NFS3_9CHLR|nr:cytochrome b/b6 domain-containing protein [Candidatus Desulfolinea nitratireducens]MBL6960720.1 cytochrome b/b6 domain-containing protein [Anaerolineales bacterium]
MPSKYLLTYRKIPGFLALTFVILGISWTSQNALAKKEETPTLQSSSLHPAIILLDENRENVIETGLPVSTMNTCGACHDAEFIESHSYHANLGLNEITSPGSTPSQRDWDITPGFFGKWNSLTYRYLSPNGDELVDLSTPAWIQFYGARHIGGGPAVYARDGETLLTNLPIRRGDPETHIVDPNTGKLVTWDWEASGVVEMNCFLCHIPDPDNDSRIKALEDGEFGWANTAVLFETGIVESISGNYVWNKEAFTENGEVKFDLLNIQGPVNDNCGLCHGLVHDDIEEPLVLSGCAPDRWSTITTGQIISSQRLSESGMNLANKEELTRPWDVHAERLLSCTDCHYSVNNPLYYEEANALKPDHLIFDPRRIEIGEYLVRPLHQFARGDSAQGTIAPNLENTMRRCDSCHDTTQTHDWLPYQDRHMSALSCESCHIPQLYSSANEMHDWTVINLDGSASTECRGMEGGDVSEIGTLVTGYAPVLLPRDNADGTTSLSPHNLITTWFWVYGNPERPVRLIDLEAAYLEGDQYHPGVMLRFDENTDGVVSKDELRIDTPEKEEFITTRLTLLGLDNPRIVGEVQPYTISHDVAGDEWATKDCATCHAEESRITDAIQISTYLPGGKLPEFVKDSNITFNGEMNMGEDGTLSYKPSSVEQDFYILGHDSVKWIDRFGGLMFIGVLLGVFAHGGLRFYSALRNPRVKPETQEVYMYSIYERLWHWLQTAAIVLLLFTGVIIHNPDSFGIFSFNGVVIVHNVLATILAVNAALSLFYHLASGEIQQYLPRPRGFFDQTILQAKFYLQGIFKGEEHPFEKTAKKKLNPLQQITYFGILNVLLPLQGLTGIMIWGVQRWPDLAAKLGGLPFLAPFHTLIAWTFASFIVLHVYLTTTGHTPMAGIKSMIMGWDKVETHVHSQEES